VQIESLEIKNYRLCRDAKLDALPCIAAVVGANGSDKSTLFGGTHVLYRGGRGIRIPLGGW